MTVKLDLDGAAAAVAGLVRETPVLSSASIGELCAGTVVLKAECLQRTGSFKLRGALAKLAHLSSGQAVVTGSAGNHGQAVAYAARVRGVACTVFMPADAALSKVAAVEGFKARVDLVGGNVEDSVAAAREAATATGAEFVHPFDDADVIAGQATLGLELADQVEDLAKVIVPVGGGGLICGLSAGLRARGRDVTVCGVQAGSCASFAESLAAGSPVDATGTAGIADGIAVRRPGRLTTELGRNLVDEMATVGDDEIAEAIVLLLERAKLVVEGAGAVGIAGLISGTVKPAPAGTTVVVLSGGNIDAGLLAAVARRHETERGRRVRIFTRVPDQPGSLATLLGLVAEGGANLLEIEHVRDAVELHVRETGVELTLETRSDAQATALLTRLAAAGYVVERLSGRSGVEVGN